MSLKKKAFPGYDEVPVIGRFRWCLDLVKSQNLKNKTIVDVGCSTGLFESKLLGERFKKIIAFDPYEPAITFARKEFLDDRVTFFTLPAEDFPTKDMSADIVTMFDVIEHVPSGSELGVFDEIRRTLKPGGVMLLTTPNYNIFTNLLDPAWYFGHRHYKSEVLTKLIEKAGLKVGKIEVRGSIWSSIYMLWFYVMKWVFGKKLPRWNWIEAKEDGGYNKSGIFTLFIEAQK